MRNLARAVNSFLLEVGASNVIRPTAGGATTATWQASLPEGRSLLVRAATTFHADEPVDLLRPPAILRVSSGSDAFGRLEACAALVSGRALVQAGTSGGSRCAVVFDRDGVPLAWADVDRFLGWAVPFVTREPETARTRLFVEGRRTASAGTGAARRWLPGGAAAAAGIGAIATAVYAGVGLEGLIAVVGLSVSLAAFLVAATLRDSAQAMLRRKVRPDPNGQPLGRQEARFRDTLTAIPEIDEVRASRRRSAMPGLAQVRLVAVAREVGVELDADLFRLTMRDHGPDWAYLLPARWAALELRGGDPARSVGPLAPTTAGGAPFGWLLDADLRALDLGWLEDEFRRLTLERRLHPQDAGRRRPYR